MDLLDRYKIDYKEIYLINKVKREIELAIKPFLYRFNTEENRDLLRETIDEVGVKWTYSINTNSIIKKLN